MSPALWFLMGFCSGAAAIVFGAFVLCYIVAWFDDVREKMEL